MSRDVRGPESVDDDACRRVGALSADVGRIDDRRATAPHSAPVQLAEEGIGVAAETRLEGVVDGEVARARPAGDVDEAIGVDGDSGGFVVLAPPESPRAERSAFGGDGVD